MESFHEALEHRSEAEEANIQLGDMLNEIQSTYNEEARLVLRLQAWQITGNILNAALNAISVIQSGITQAAARGKEEACEVIIDSYKAVLHDYATAKDVLVTGLGLSKDINNANPEHLDALKQLTNFDVKELVNEFDTECVNMLAQINEQQTYVRGFLKEFDKLNN